MKGKILDSIAVFVYMSSVVIFIIVGYAMTAPFAPHEECLEYTELIGMNNNEIKKAYASIGVVVDDKTIEKERKRCLKKLVDIKNGVDYGFRK